ncbi:MAG TPA: cardiolipin synthase [Phycisphaerae bacterium]|nr:cardiolipin synthase [Phycisphaerae bacterium]
MAYSHLWTVLSILNYAGVLLAIEHILRTRREPRGMLAWILALLLLPFAGLILFLLVGNLPVQRKVRRRRNRRRLIESALARRSQAVAQEHAAMLSQEVDPHQNALIHLATHLGETAVTRGNEVSIYYDGERMFSDLTAALEAARHHIHMEYYIFAPDETGRAIRDLIARKAKQGVEVRLLMDAVGSRRIGRQFLAPLREAGAAVEFFMPWGISSRRLGLNCRNHRKIVVVDGTIGFTGSHNVGDEYLGRRRKFGPWRDTHLRLRGPSVTQLQEVFVEDWHFAARHDLSGDPYFPMPDTSGKATVQIMPTGPDRRPYAMHQLLLGAAADAKHSICLLTPYFVPDHAMLLALQTARLRGMQVQLLVPSRSDHRLVLWAARGCYEELLEAGVEIFEYPHAMLHSKVMIVDRRWAMVGSANMDERSFRINWEVSTLLFDRGLAGELQDDFEQLRSRAQKMNLQAVRSWTYSEKMLSNMARLATPML